MRKFCSNCQEWQDSWADHPNYESSRAYKRYERCWKCDEWTLRDRAIFVSRSSIVSRERVQEWLNKVRTGQTNRFTCGAIKYTSSNGETVHERLVYDGGETYTRIIEKGGRQMTETKKLQTFEEVFFLEFIEAVIEEPIRAICPVQ